MTVLHETAAIRKSAEHGSLHIPEGIADLRELAFHLTQPPVTEALAPAVSKATTDQLAAVTTAFLHWLHLALHCNSTITPSCPL
jgi:hypothetical protein